MWLRLDLLAGPHENEHEHEKNETESNKEEILHGELEAEDEIDPGGKLIAVTRVIEGSGVVE